MISASKIQEIQSEILHYVQGPLGVRVQRILPPEQANPEALVFVSKQDQLETALKNNASIIVAHKSLKIPEKAHPAFFTTPHVQLAMATVAPFFDKKVNRFTQEEHIHPKSFVHPTAKLGKNVIIGPSAVIGAEVHVGDNSIIGANAVVETHARIGANSTIHPLVYIGAYCEVGDHCEIHPNTTIGADGFGFVPTKDRPVKIPQIGRVVIGDYVEIGANCAIDRAAITETKIHSGTKMDNLVHIAHNCEIGENGLIAAGFMMAGSSKIGKHFMVGGGAVVADHIQISDQVMLAGLSGVTNDINEPGQYGGYPLQPLKDSLKTLVNLTYLNRMRKQLSQIMKHLNLTDEA